MIRMWSPVYWSVACFPLRQCCGAQWVLVAATLSPAAAAAAAAAGASQPLAGVSLSILLEKHQWREKLEFNPRQRISLKTKSIKVWIISPLPSSVTLTNRVCSAENELSQRPELLFVLHGFLQIKHHRHTWLWYESIAAGLVWFFVDVSISDLRWSRSISRISLPSTLASRLTMGRGD